jgi:hypothetical protein
MTTDMSLVSVKKLSSLHQKNQRHQAQMEKRMVMAQKSTIHLRSTIVSRQSEHKPHEDPMAHVDDVAKRSKVSFSYHITPSRAPEQQPLSAAMWPSYASGTWLPVRAGCSPQLHTEPQAC